jgi:hypothetical protein
MSDDGLPRASKPLGSRRKEDFRPYGSRSPRYRIVRPTGWLSYRVPWNTDPPYRYPPPLPPRP